MKKIKEKIKELMSISKKEDSEFGQGLEAVKAKLDAQDEIMSELKKLAQEENTLLGRIIKFPKADSYAMYVITKVNKKTVRVDWFDWCDGWVDDRCGYAATVDIDYVRQKVNGEDALSKLFS